MSLLLDTHAFLWFIWADPLLSLRARQHIEDPSNRKLLSIASVWEIAIKVGNGKLTLGAPTNVAIPRELAANSIDVLEITVEHAAAVETLPQHHRDPFDRLLIAQSTIEGMALLSADTIFDRYGVTRIW